MKNIIKSIILITLLIISTSCKSTSNKELNYDNFDLAIMIENEKEAGKYEKYEGIDWPDKEDYTLNTALSTCEDNNTIEWDEEKGTIYLTSNKWDKCIAKFDKIIKIEYIEDLVELSNRVNEGDSLKGKTVKLMKDLDFQKTEDYENSSSTKYGDFNNDGIKDQAIYQELTNEEGNGFVPIGTETNPFEGIFDGNNYKLSNLYINNVKNINSLSLGLIGVIKDSEVSDLTVSGNIKNGTSLSNAGLISNASGEVKLTNIVNEVDITSNSPNWTIGGVVATIYESGNLTIEKCTNKGSITGGNNTGGIMGGAAANSKVVINNSVNYGDVTSNDGTNVSGVLGYANDNVKVIIDDCVNHGKIEAIKPSTSAKETNIGGILGKANGETFITNSINEITVENESGILVNNKGSGSTFVGGLIGLGKITNIESSKNKSKITVTNGQSYIGGIIGKGNELTQIRNSYNTGQLEGSLDKMNRLGGLVGFNENKAKVLIDKCYNIGNIESKNGGDSGYVAGGLVGTNSLGSNVYIINSYNAGNLLYNGNSTYPHLSGIISEMSSDDSHGIENVYIWNTYNSGNITTNNDLAAGFLNDTGGETSNVENIINFNNVFNIGTLTSNPNYGIARINKSKVTLNNAYYKKQESMRGLSKGEDAMAMEEAAMKSDTFVTTLNNNKNSIELNEIKQILISEGLIDSKYVLELSDWVLGPDGYPTLEGVAN